MEERWLSSSDEGCSEFRARELGRVASPQIRHCNSKVSPVGMVPWPTLPGQLCTCMWWYRSSGASPMEPSPSITMFPASLDACEEREDDEWRPVPIKFMGL